MATIFRVASDEERKPIDYALRQWHKELSDAAVRIGVIFAHNEDGDAVKHGGYPAAACIKSLPLKERVVKGYDAELLIDEQHWDEKDEAGKRALADHELSHLKPVPKTDKELRRDPSTCWKTDDIRRPKLRSVKGDWNVGDGFSEVVSRHGENSQEYTNIRTAKRLADRAAALGGGIEVEEAVV